jgi:hypothetical protein
MKDPVKINVQVEREVWLAFKNYVVAKYGQLKGSLGEEVTRALDEYLKDSQPAHTQEFEHKLSKPNKRHIGLLVWLLNNYPHEVLYSDLKNYVMDNYGFDQRTIKKYIHGFLIGEGFLKSKKGYGRNILFEVKTEWIINYLKKYVPEKDLREKYGLQEIGIEKEKDQEEKTELKSYITDRYEAGDSLDEVTEKVSDFGLILTKKAVRNMIRDVRREEYV